MRLGSGRPIPERFWKNVQKTDGCWLWTGTVSSRGKYGTLCWAYGNKPIRAHRLSWLLHKGPIPNELCVLHHCDNRLCVRPSHLFLGTRKDNYHDMARKGRRPPYLGQFDGSKACNAKLTEGKVLRAKELYRNGKKTMSEMAREYGVNCWTLRAAVLGIQWKFLSTAENTPPIVHRTERKYLLTSGVN